MHCKKLCIGTLTDTNGQGNQQNHVLVLLGAFQEAKRQLGEMLLETKVELGESKTKSVEKTLKKPGEKKTLEKYGDKVNFCMTITSVCTN